MKYDKHELSTIAARFPRASHFVHMTLPGDKELTFVVGSTEKLTDAIRDNKRNLVTEHGYKWKTIRTKSYRLPEVVVL